MGKKLIWKFNIIDILLIVLISLSIVALVYKTVKGSSGKEREFVLTCVCENSPTELLYGIKTGDTCVDGETGEELGVISGCTVTPNAENDGKGRAEIYAVVSGTKEKHGIYVENSVYLKGKTFSLIVDDSVFYVYISDISEF